MLKVIKSIINVTKKIFLVIAVYFVVINLFLYFINKDKPMRQMTNDPIKKNRQEIYKILNDKKINSTKEGKITVAIYRAMMCGIIGEACTNNPDDADKNFNHSLFGYMTSLIVLPYANPPASGIYWAYSGLQNAGFVPKTYAAEGIGFAAIKPFMNLWKVFRDVSYMILVLVLIAIGFMIMFRMKLNPQTVISVENALPKIVVSLLLITFSFAIAGFLIDLMYVLIAIIISIVSNNGAYYNPVEFQNKYLNAGFGQIWDGMFPVKKWGSGIPIIGGFSTLLSVGDAIMAILPQWINNLIRGMVVFFFSYPLVVGPLTNLIENTKIKNVLSNINIVGNSIGRFTETVIGTVLTYSVIALVLPPLIIHGGGFLIGIVVFFTILLLLFRIFFLIFKAYLQILLMIIFSPLFLLFEAIPGKSVFSFWFKNLIGEIITFPIVIALFVVGYVMINTLGQPGNNWTPPFLYGFNPQAFSILLGMGIIFMIPDLVKTAKELLGIKGLPIPFGLGTFFAGVGTGVGGATGFLGQFSSIGLGLTAMGLSKRTGLLGLFGELKEPYKPLAPTGSGAPTGDTTKSEA